MIVYVRLAAGHAQVRRAGPADGQRRRGRARSSSASSGRSSSRSSSSSPARSATSRPGSRTSARRRSATPSRPSRGRPPSRCPATSRPRASSSRGSTRSRGEDYPLLRDALEKLHLNDASFTYEPESSVALGFGFRCGFLGLLHMEIVQERLEREFSLDLIASAPSVEYHVILTHGRGTVVVDNPALLPGPTDIEVIEEPWVKLSVVTPSQYIGPLMELSTNRRGDFVNMEYLDPTRVVLHFEMPLAELIVDYFDQLKSRSQGYASMDYEELGYRPANLVKVDILVNGEPVDALSLIVHRDRAPVHGPRAGRAAQAADPAPDVRDPDPGGHRIERRRPRNGPGDAQERARQVLRWRHHAQAQAAREAEGGQAAHEAGRVGRDPAGGVPGDAAHGRGVDERRVDDYIAWSRSLITSGSPCSWSCSASTPSGSGRPSTTRRRATASSPKIRRRHGLVRRSASAWPSASSTSTPNPQQELFLGSGDRLGAVLGGLAYGLGGVAFAVAFATFRYHRIRFPDAWSYPGALLNSVATAFIDEVAFRGAIFGLLLSTGIERRASRTSSRRSCTRSSTRLGAPGRDRYLLVHDARHGPRRRLADRGDRRHRRGLPRPRDHPVRGLPVHRPRGPDEAARPRGRGDREAPPAARGLAGHRRPREPRRDER